jgi:aminoglycoside phosphotransferase (APT) family kinase protein
VHRLKLSGVEDVVIQRFVLDWIREEPWLPANEVRVLKLLEEIDLPAPKVLAADLDGVETGCPTVLMSALPGRVVWRPMDIDVWLNKLVDIALAIHAVPVRPELLSWAPYAPENAPPSWTRHPEAWAQAVDAFHRPQPAADRVFLHRDFHPGNVLWVEGRVTGIVDWVSSCVGPPEEDIAHCRINLARSHGQRVADDFLARWLAATGRTSYDPYFDLVTAVSMATKADRALDDFVLAAARRQ